MFPYEHFSFEHQTFSLCICGTQTEVCGTKRLLFRNNVSFTQTRFVRQRQCDRRTTNRVVRKLKFAVHNKYSVFCATPMLFVRRRQCDRRTTNRVVRKLKFAVHNKYSVFCATPMLFVRRRQRDQRAITRRVTGLWVYRQRYRS